MAGVWNRFLKHVAHFTAPAVEAMDGFLRFGLNSDICSGPSA